VSVWHCSFGGREKHSADVGVAGCPLAARGHIYLSTRYVSARSLAGH
jgi:hypothetical protein